MNIERQLSLVPLQTLDAVLLQHGIAFSGSKDDAIATIKQLIVDGKTSVAEVKATKASATHTLLNTPSIQAGVNVNQLNALNTNVSNWRA